MTMLKEYGFTNARQNFSSVFDDMQNFIPSLIKARKQSESDGILLHNGMFKELLLSNYQFEIEVTREDTGEVSLWDNVTNFGAFGDSEDEAIRELALVLKGYAEGYYEQANIFLNDSNTRKQFPYILRVLMCDSTDEIESILKENLCPTSEI